MTTNIKARRTPKNVGKAKKPLRIREEFLPKSARYITIDDIEYVAMPVADFGEWFEEVELGAVLDDRKKDTAPAIPFDQAVEEIKASRKTKP